MKPWDNDINKSFFASKENSYEKFKTYDRFKFLYVKMKGRVKNGDNFLDMGCGKGEFIYFLKDCFPCLKLNYAGVEISKELVASARREPKLKDVDFILGDIKHVNLRKKFSHVLMNGVLSIFDDFQIPLRTMVKHIKKGGYGYIFGCFNAENIDVLVRYRNNYMKSKVWESGLNLLSLFTLKKALARFSKKLNIYHFNLSVDLPKKKNPIRSYTLDTTEGKKIILNGANVLTDFYLVVFRR